MVSPQNLVARSMNKNDGCPELGTEGTEVDNIWKWQKQGMVRALTQGRATDSGSQREVAPLSGGTGALWADETLLLLGLNFPSIKWGHYCRKVNLFNLLFSVVLFYILVLSRQCFMVKDLNNTKA